MKKISLSTPLSIETVTTLKAGDFVLISGDIYTGRDAAHKRLVAALKEEKPLPIDLKDQIIYYAGPTPPPEGKLFQSCGPTTSGRMDVYTPELLEKTGLRAMIGKGDRSRQVIEAIKKFKCVYFAAPGGCGALCGQSIRQVSTVCYEDLGAEAMYHLTVENFPAIVAIDSFGFDVYDRRV